MHWNICQRTDNQPHSFTRKDKDEQQNALTQYNQVFNARLDGENDNIWTTNNAAEYKAPYIEEIIETYETLTVEGAEKNDKIGTAEKYKIQKEIKLAPDENIDRVCIFICENRRRTIDILEDLSWSTIRRILYEDLAMKRVAVYYVSRLLTSDQKWPRVACGDMQKSLIKIIQIFLQNHSWRCIRVLWIWFGHNNSQANRGRPVLIPKSIVKATIIRVFFYLRGCTLKIASCWPDSVQRIFTIKFLISYKAGKTQNRPDYSQNQSVFEHKALNVFSFTAKLTGIKVKCNKHFTSTK